MKIDPFIDDRFGQYFAADPIVTYDIGAAGTLYDPFKGLAAGRVNIVGFEPVQESFDALKRRYGNHDNVQLLQTALSDTTGEAKFHIYPGVPTNSSLMERDHSSGREVKEITVECATLDDLIRRDNLKPPDFLKIDTEGSELQILKGGQETLSSAVMGVYCEVGYALPATAGAQASEIDAYLAHHDFMLFDIQISRSDSQAIGGKKTR